MKAIIAVLIGIMSATTKQRLICSRTITHANISNWKSSVHRIQSLQQRCRSGQ
jgi:hypothetical protein